MSPSGRPYRLLALGALLLASGCVHAGRPGGSSAPSPPAPAPSSWALPAATLGRQTLWRAQVDGPEGDVSLRLTLRLESPERYQLTVADRLGRGWLALDTTAPGGPRLIDHRGARVCLLERELPVTGLPFSPLPLDVLPALLLGRAPVAPATGEAPVADGEQAFTDAAGRRWSVERERGEVRRWTLWEGDEPALWFRADRGERHLTDRVRGLQMSWQKVADEPLSAPLTPLEAPADYAVTPCSGADLAGM